MKLSIKQFKVIETLRMYPNEMVMSNMWITGGHGIKFDGRTIDSLIKRKIIINGRLSEKYQYKYED